MGAERARLRELARALEGSGHCNEGQPFIDAVRTGLEAHITDLVDTSGGMKKAMLIHFGIGPERVEYAGEEVRLTGLRPDARREVAALVAGEKKSQYDRNRKGRPGPLRRALAELSTSLQPQGAVAQQGSVELEARNAAAHKFDQAWALLHRCRTCGEDRRDRLDELAELVGELEHETGLAEAYALDELCRYEKNRRLEAHRLLQGVSLLERATKIYEGGAPALRTQVSLQLMTEYVHLFLTGDRVPGGRFAYLEKLRDLANELLARDDLGPHERARCHLALGEALKERAMVTNEGPDHRKLYKESREHCMLALEAAEKISEEEEKRRIVSAAKRHIAVTYEMEGDGAADGDSRNQCFRLWLRYSEQGARSAEGLDDSIRAYALMNAASAHARLATAEVVPKKGDEHLELAEKYLDESLSLVAQIDDVRGQGWVHIHFSDHYGSRFMRKARDGRGLDDDGKTPIELLHEWETHANLALGHLKQLEDSMGLSLAYLELGKAMHYRGR